jgi:hypothetical protein
MRPTEKLNRDTLHYITPRDCRRAVDGSFFLRAQAKLGDDRSGKAAAVVPVGFKTGPQASHTRSGMVSSLENVANGTSRNL